MAIGLEDKKAIVAEVSEVANEALSLVVADSRGCTVAEMTDLRRQAREANVNVRVVRNIKAEIIAMSPHVGYATDSRYNGPEHQQVKQTAEYYVQ